MPALLPSELPVRARIRPHWIIVLRPPPKAGVIAVLILTVLGLIEAWIWIFLIVVLALIMMQRIREYRSEEIILTGKRIIRTYGLPETTRGESFLRLDRISGARLTETLVGKVFKYATIDLVAPGDHLEVHVLQRIAHPHEFYLRLRELTFGETIDAPVDTWDDYVTEELPHIDGDNGHHDDAHHSMHNDGGGSDGQVW